MHHELKVWPVFFQRLIEGTKNWEIRKDDRNFDAGDTARLREWDPTHQKYTGHWIEGQIPFVMKEVMGLKEGYCAFTFTVTMAGLDEGLPKFEDVFPAAKGDDANTPDT